MSEDVTERNEYYLCTFQISGREAWYYNTLAIDCHPVDYMLDKPELILINHIEMTRDQYDRHGSLR